LCSPEDAAAVNDFYQARIDKLPGGPRPLTIATERIAACAAMANTQRESAHKFMSTIHPKPLPATPTTQGTAQN
jgi:hypothetical protein